MKPTKNKKEKTIAFITCYMGGLPWYFKFFVHSCKYNPTVDFYILTDDRSYSKSVPPNVIIIDKTLAEINELASQKLGFKTNINYPYKLCDFKPTYGYLFSDLIQGYDFWGYVDIDLIFGDIRSFITNDLLDHYEIINARHDFLPGYFLLYKNNERMRTLFMKSNDYRKALASHIYYCFDETNYQYDEFMDEHYGIKRKQEIESMTHLVKKMMKKGEIKAYFDFHIMDGVPGKIKWESGKLYYKNEYEILLYHLILFKKVGKPSRIRNIPDTLSYKSYPNLCLTVIRHQTNGL